MQGKIAVIFCDLKHFNFDHFKRFYFLLGDYAGFDKNEPTSQSGGKAKVIQELKSKYKYDKIVMIGDGMTDAEACPPADAFIGK